MTAIDLHPIPMIRDLLKWLACGFVVVLGLALVNWGPATSASAKKALAETDGRPAIAVASGEPPAPGGERAQP